MYEKNIESLKKILSQLYNKKNSFNHLSIEDHATSVKNEFIISNTIYDSKNNLVINYNDNLDYIILQNFIFYGFSNLACYLYLFVLYWTASQSEWLFSLFLCFRHIFNFEQCLLCFKIFKTLSTHTS